MHLSQKHIVERLGKYFSTPVPPGAIETDYKTSTGLLPNLVHFEPMRPGNAVFYSWIAAQKGYYPAWRWEYGHVRSYVESDKNIRKLADIGCGDGKFIEEIRRATGIDVFGVDTLEESVAICRSRGIDAYCGEMGQMLRTQPHLRHSFDLVTSFHCLEHVPDPMAFLSELTELVKANGKICVSTPLSPMPFEHAWFDPQNHPPHHLSRWTLGAYRNAARALGMNVEFVTPQNGSLAQWIFRTFRLRITNSPFRAIRASDMPTIILETLRLPITAWQTFSGQLKAEVRGCPTVLAIFTRK